MSGPHTPDPTLGPIALAHALAQALGIQLREVSQWHKVEFYAANCGGTLVTSGIRIIEVDDKGEPVVELKVVKT